MLRPNPGSIELLIDSGSIELDLATQQQPRQHRRLLQHLQNRDDIRDRYDEAGPLYVVRKRAHDDFSYTLVMKRGGRLYEVYGTPIWAADKSRFVTVACSLSPPRGTLSIAAPSADGLTTEAEFPLPCEEQSCSARWDFQSWISVSCAPHDSSGKKGAEFVLTRGNDNTWRKFGR